VAALRNLNLGVRQVVSVMLRPLCSWITHDTSGKTNIKVKETLEVFSAGFCPETKTFNP